VSFRMAGVPYSLPLSCIGIASCNLHSSGGCAQSMKTSIEPMAMFRFRPFRAFMYGLAVAGPLTLLTGVLYTFETTTPYARIALLMLPFLSALATAMLVHAVDAIIWATILSYLGAMLIGFLVVGFEYMIEILWSNLGTYMFAAAVLGAIVGIFLRPWVRARYNV
jgi:hypothetical protein